MSPGSFVAVSVHWGARRGLPFHSGSLGLLGRTYGLPGLFEFASVQCGAPSGHRVLSGSLGLTLALIGVAGLIRVHRGSLLRA